MIDGLIYETKTGKPIAWIKKAMSFTASRIGGSSPATIRNGVFYSLTGALLGVTLHDLNDDPDVLAKLKDHAEREAPQEAA